MRIGAGISSAAAPLKNGMRAPKNRADWLAGDGVEPLKSWMERAWESLTEGWRELLTRSSGALTHFGTEGARDDEPAQEFPHWSLLAAETWETARSVVIRIEIPGMAEEDLTVDVHGNVLRIHGQKRSGPGQEARRYHLMERAYGQFKRSIPLPHSVNADAAEVSYRDGVLTVILPKTEPLPPRRLTITG
jgi:HSP20 family protein